MRHQVTILLLFGFFITLHAETYRIISYNVENLFDATHDTLKNDLDFTPTGKYRWTYTRFRHKAHQIARTICQIGQWETPLMVGICEVENENCVRQLIRQLPSYPYAYLHRESPDERGIDVAVLYDSTRFHILHWNILPVPLNGDKTRDILYAKGLTASGDTLHLMMCHLPSMRGGKAQSEWKRQRAKQVIQHHTDSILRSTPQAFILVMGDMNSDTKNDIKGLNNCMVALEKEGIGSYKWQGQWSCLDQMYVSPALIPHTQARIFSADNLLTPDKRYMGKQPRRTFTGYRYDKSGVSDHLPAYLDWQTE